MKYIFNLTEETIKIVDNSGYLIRRFNGTEQYLNYKVENKPDGNVEGVPVVKYKTKEARNLPDPAADVLYIVEREDAFRLQRTDLVWPADPLYDSWDQVIGYQSLKHI